MKKKLAKSAWEALSPEIQKLYKLVGSDYILEVEDDDAGELRRALDRERQAAKTAKDNADALQAQLDSMTSAQRRQAGDIAAIEADWQKKVDKAKSTGDAEVARLKGLLHKQLVYGEALKIATAISDAPTLIVDRIASRLSAEIDGETPLTRVLDAQGKPSAMSLKELQQEFVDNPEYSRIIIGSKANGGADGRNRTGGGSSGAGQLTLEQFKAMGDADRGKLFKENPEAFKRLSDEQKASLRRF